MLFFRKRSKTPDPQEGKMSNPWEKEKKSYQSTIENLLHVKPTYTPTLALRSHIKQRTIQQSCSPIRYKLPR